MEDMSAVQIHLSSYEVWTFFENNEERLGKEMVCIAENKDTGYSVFLEEKSGIPFFKIFRDEEFEYGEAATCAFDCREVAQKLYRKYLFPITVQEDKYWQDIPQYEDDDDMPPSDDMDEDELIQALDDIVYERDDELCLAAQDFLSTLLNVMPGEVELLLKNEDIFTEFIDAVCEMLAERFKISVYRPQWIPDGDVQNFVEYPYLAVDDETTIAGVPSDFGDFNYIGAEG